MGIVAPPSSGLGSNSNYFFADSGKNLLNVKVEVDITQDLISNIGFGLQLNAFSPAGDYSAWQQFFFSYRTSNGSPPGSPGTLYGGIEPWPVTTSGVSNDTTTGDLINYQPQLLTLQDSNFRAGYKLSMLLGNESNGNVRYVTFTVIDNNGHQVANQTYDMLTLNIDGSGTKATEKDLAPITAFTFDIVGPINGEQTFFWSGAGNIKYSSTNQLTAQGTLPTNLDSDWHTLENGNSQYGELQQGSNTSFTQTFSTATLPAYLPGGSLAVSQQFGSNQTNVYAIDRAGQLVVFYAGGGGHWSATTGLGPTGMAIRGAGLAASQQFGAQQQTDLFFVNQGGQLNTMWVEGTGAWNGPVPIGGGGLFPTGAAVATSQQFGAPNQTDAFVFDNNGVLNVFWVQSAGAWGGPVKVGSKNTAPPGCALVASQQFGAPNQTDVFFFDNNGQLNVFWVQGTGGWSDPVKIGSKGKAPAGARLAVSQQFGAPNQTDVFFIDNNGQLNVFWVQGTGGWGGPVAISSPGIAPPGSAVAASRQFGTDNQTDVFVIDNNGQLNVFWVQGTGAWNGPDKVGPKNVAKPGADIVASQQFGLTNQTDVFVLNQSGTNGPGWPVVYWVDGAGQWNGPKALVTEV